MVEVKWDPPETGCDGNEERRGDRDSGRKFNRLAGQTATGGYKSSPIGCSGSGNALRLRRTMNFMKVQILKFHILLLSS